MSVMGMESWSYSSKEHPWAKINSAHTVDSWDGLKLPQLDPDKNRTAFILNNEKDGPPEKSPPLPPCLC